MAKETKASENKGPETETIAVTESQKADFLKFLEKQEEEKIKKEDEDRYKGMTTKVNLNFQHNINGKKLGPGRNIVIPYELLGLLQHQEDQAKDANIKMLTSNKRTFEILQSGQSIEVGGARVGGQQIPAGLK